MKRDLFVAENLFPLGPARALIAQALQHVSQGVEVHLAARSNHLHLEWLDGLPITIHRLPDVPKAEMDGGKVLTRRNLKTIIELRQLIGDLKPDSVHAGGEKAAAWTQLAALSTIFSAQGRRLPELVYREFRIPKSPLIFKSVSHWADIRFAQAVVPHQVLKNSLINHDFNGVIRIEPVGLKQLQMIPHFCQFDRSASRELLREHLGLEAGTKIAGTVAPLIPRTRIKDLIWATDLLSVVRDDFHFVIFGTGSQDERLKQFADCTEASERIHFIGEPSDAWPMFQGLDVYWHSHLGEPMPLNLLTAMSLGIPVISILGEGTSDLILHQQTGFGVNFGARDEFARWTKYLFEQNESATRISEQGRQYVQNRFSL